MKSFRSIHLRRVLVPLMAVSLMSACSTWKVQELTPSQVVAEKQPSKIRLTTLDGEKIEVFDPAISDDVIIGHARGWYDGVTRRHVRSGTLRVATDSVARIEIRETDALATVLVVTLGLASVLAVAVLIAFSEFELYGG